MSDVKLLVNKKEFSGWKSARITRGIESVAGSFDLEVSDRWVHEGVVQSWPIGEEDACQVKLGNTIVITGYVDQRSISYGSSEHSLRVSGRDKSGDLVDCSAFLNKWEFHNIGIEAFINQVCTPYGIDVTFSEALGQSETAKIAKLSIDPGDTAFEAIEKACRMAGLLVFSDGDGGIVLARAGTGRCKTALVEGENILSASADFDASQRFSTYAVLGQQTGSDNKHGKASAHIKGVASDLNVKRAARTLLVRAEKSVTLAQAAKRAQWEATVRAGKSQTINVKVQGWTQANGDLWPINTLVAVKSPMLGIHGDLLISQATYSLDDSGTTTQLVLRDPKAFTPEPVITKPTGSNIWKEIAGGV